MTSNIGTTWTTIFASMQALILLTGYALNASTRSTLKFIPKRRVDDERAAGLTYPPNLKSRQVSYGQEQ